MTNFTKITSNAKYPSHVVNKAAFRTLMNAVHHVNDRAAKAILRMKAMELRGKLVA